MFRIILSDTYYLDDKKRRYYWWWFLTVKVRQQNCIFSFQHFQNVWTNDVVSSSRRLSLSLSLCVCVGQCDQIWRNFANLANFLILFEGSFRNWQKFEPNLGNIFAIGQIFNVVNGQILKQIIKPSGHTGVGPNLRIFLLLVLCLPTDNGFKTLKRQKPRFNFFKWVFLPWHLFRLLSVFFKQTVKILKQISVKNVFLVYSAENRTHVLQTWVTYHNHFKFLLQIKMLHHNGAVCQCVRLGTVLTILIYAVSSNIFSYLG